METISNNHLFTLQTLRFLLEQLLSGYVAECKRKNPKKGELDRLERAFKESYISMAQDLAKTIEAPRYKEVYRDSSLVDGVLKDMIKRQESAEYAINRFVLEHRFPTKSV